MKVSLNWDNGKKLDFQAENKLNIFDIPAEPESRKLHIFCELPLADIHSLWYERPLLHGGPIPVMLWQAKFTAAQNSGLPFLAFFNRSSVLRGAFGLTNLIDEAEFCAKINQQDCTYEVSIVLTLAPESGSCKLFVDLRKNIEWTESLAQWRNLQNIPLPEFPEAAWNPVFCTWYAVHACVTEDWVEKIVPQISDLGFKTLIIDDGWCYDDFKRVTPQTLEDWYSVVGDWEISKAKFPDFPAHVKRVQDMGMKYMVWVAPHMIGTKSRFFTENNSAVLLPVHEGCGHLDVNFAEETEILCSKVADFARDNNLDGLKIDFLDVVQPEISDPRGRKTLQMVKNLVSRIRQDNPEALIEFRQCYATLAMMPYATQFRAGDAPFDWMLNFHRIVNIRLCMGDKVPAHADPAYWAKDEEAKNVSRHMIAMLAGVPMLSMDPDTLSDRDRQIVKYWIDFYNDNRKLLNFGHWQIDFGYRDVTMATVDDDTGRIAIVSVPGAERKAIAGCLAGKELKILNLSDEELPFAGAECFNPDGTPTEPGKIVPGGWGKKK